MITEIGNVLVSTIMIRRRGWILWETAVLTYTPNSEGHWCYAEPKMDVFDRYLTQAESWIGHALILGYLRVGRELEAGAPVRIAAVGEPFRGLLAEALLMKTAPVPLAPEPHVKSA